VTTGEGGAATESRAELLAVLQHPEPVVALRSFVLELSRAGQGRDWIYQLLLAEFIQAEEAGLAGRAEAIGDVLDMVVGWYSPWNLELPE
jgi:hypothetical protein